MPSSDASSSGPGPIGGFISYQIARNVVRCDREIGVAVGWMTADGPDEFAIERVYERIPSPHRQRVRDTFLQGIVTRSPIVCRYPVENPSGHLYHLVFEGRLLHDGQGQPDTIFGFLSRDEEALPSAAERIADHSLAIHHIAAAHGMTPVVRMAELMLAHLVKQARSEASRH